MLKNDQHEVAFELSYDSLKTVETFENQCKHFKNFTTTIETKKGNKATCKWAFSHKISAYDIQKLFGGLGVTGVVFEGKTLTLREFHQKLEARKESKE